VGAKQKRCTGMTRAQALDYRRRWKLVNAREQRELRKTPVAVKFQQLAALMGSVDAMGWREALEEGVEEVRARWVKLHRIYHAGK